MRYEHISQNKIPLHLITFLYTDTVAINFFFQRSKKDIKSLITQMLVTDRTKKNNQQLNMDVIEHQK